MSGLARRERADQQCPPGSGCDPCGPAGSVHVRHEIVLKIVGLISDTHGLLRPEAAAALQGCELILHAGDVGGPDIVAELGRMAPVTAIRGNVDRGAWALSFPKTEVVELDAGVLAYMLHDLGALDIDPVAAGFQVVVSGHSHKPGFRWKDGVLYVNPGSAGPRRFSSPISLGRLMVDGGALTVELTELK